ncbi:hydrogenase expression/formation protein HypE [Sporolituus thermophilus]|uniref:Hydrogenase expression/formation protein HypE n=1 Tax=Sporolituus thermophilus DSM 23256 TaxID=1123285 RepID=A0A1G7N4X2_9FIRM|nr:hydrogenase expression/formation protein HypE [Sporolituus thermophilus]SDF68380.1 hydrogenase expression/formation protein HypE [Sporolituus thermophilus DSM 23256]
MSERIQLAHGSGGKLSHDLVREVMLPAFANAALAEMHDGAKVTAGGARLAFTTDSYVVKPLFFAGGDIGKLAVCGTVNDLAMTGAVPLYLSAGFIIEEGFAIDDLRRIVVSMRRAADEAGVAIVTGDTKVVEKGAVDGLYINTAGVGVLLDGVDISPRRVRPGQDIILSGPIGDHAIAIMSERHGLTLPASVTSDCAPLAGLVKAILTAVPDGVAVLRDPTRGGIATTLNEIASQAQVGIFLDETAIPVRPAVQAVCEILGFDPLYLANEGKMLVFVEQVFTEQVLNIMNAHPYGREARVIGRVTAQPAGQVGLRTAIGGMRLLDMLVGDQLPRIC